MLLPPQHSTAVHTYALKADPATILGNAEKKVMLPCKQEGNQLNPLNRATEPCKRWIFILIGYLPYIVGRIPSNASLQHQQISYNNYV